MKAKSRSRKEMTLLTECDDVQKKRKADMLYIRKKLHTVYTVVDEQPRERSQDLKAKRFDDATRAIKEILICELEIKKPEDLRMVQIVNDIIDRRIVDQLNGLRYFLALFLKEYAQLANVY